MIDNSNDETSFPHKLLLSNTLVTNPHKAFANNSLVNIKLSKTQLSKIIQSGGFLGRCLGQLLRTGLPLIKNLIQSLAKSALILLGLTESASAAETGIHKKILVSGSYDPRANGSETKILTISNDEIAEILKIVESLDDSVFLSKVVGKKIKMK